MTQPVSASGDDEELKALLDDVLSAARWHRQASNDDADYPSPSNKKAIADALTCIAASCTAVESLFGRIREERDALTVLAASLLCELGYATEPRLDAKGVSLQEILQKEPAPWTAVAKPLTFDQAQSVLAEYRARSAK